MLCNYIILKIKSTNFEKYFQKFKKITGLIYPNETISKRSEVAMWVVISLMIYLLPKAVRSSFINTLDIELRISLKQ